MSKGIYNNNKKKTMNTLKLNLNIIIITLVFSKISQNLFKYHSIVKNIEKIVFD